MAKTRTSWKKGVSGNKCGRPIKHNEWASIIEGLRDLSISCEKCSPRILDIVGKIKNKVSPKKREKATSDGDRGGVYFFESCGLVKIGISADWVKRLSSIRYSGASVVDIVAFKRVPGCERLSVESELHKMFSCDNSHGEWFRFSDRIKKYIDDNGLWMANTGKE